MADTGDRVPRVAAVWCPDWPVIAAAATADGLSAHIPAAVVHANRIVASSAVARAAGVRRGMRRRQAQAACPELVVFAHDADRDARVFEPVVSAVEELAPGVEVLRPGLCVFAARGPSRYFRGDDTLAELLIDEVAQRCGVEAMVGVAEGTLAATLAARAGAIIAPGQTREFLAGLPISALDDPDLVDLLHRLGINTLGAFAGLPARDVAGRFGAAGARLHRLARGQQERPLTARIPPVEIAVETRPDPPIERVDTAAFAARALAEQLRELLAGQGLACTRLGIEAETSNGEHLTRVWRHDGALGAHDIADRTRWQLNGWLTARAGRADPQHPTAGISRLRLIAEEVVNDGGLQLGLWGEMGDDSARAHRALSRLHGMLGPHGVLTPVLGGGRDLRDEVQTVAWRDERVPARPDDQPWPGTQPAPSPPRKLPNPVPAAVTDPSGEPVILSDRMTLTQQLHQVRVGDRPPRTVVDWAGPWPIDERWWDTQEAHHRIRVQVYLAAADGASTDAWLLIVEKGQWFVDWIYD